MGDNDRAERDPLQNKWLVTKINQPNYKISGKWAVIGQGEPGITISQTHEKMGDE